MPYQQTHVQKDSKKYTNCIFFGRKTNHPRIENSGITKEERNAGIFVPDGYSSDLEDDYDGEIDEAMNGNTNNKSFEIVGKSSDNVCDDSEDENCEESDNGNSEDDCDRELMEIMKGKLLMIL